MSLQDRVKLTMAGVMILGTTAYVRIGADSRSLWCRGLTVEEIVDAAERMRRA